MTTTLTSVLERYVEVPDGEAVLPLRQEEGRPPRQGVRDTLARAGDKYFYGKNIW